MERKKLPLVILISGNGSNLQAIIDAARDNLLPIDIKVVISSKSSAYGLQRADNAGLMHRSLSPEAFKDRASYDQALINLITPFEPQLIILAGFMQILGSNFLKAFKNKILNIHPSLLPKYPGLHTHQLAVKEREKEHGCSIHFVNENLDAGPLIAQAVIKLKQEDNVDVVKERVHRAEHFLYPTVINWFCADRVSLENDQVRLDNIPLPKKGLRFIFNSL